MITIRQLEALHWIERLGTFERAAARLNTTQSAISKRIQELEHSTGVQVFDRRFRGARLTARGEVILGYAREILTLSDAIAGARDGASVAPKKVRIGVTELVAWTWLPKLVNVLVARFPGIEIELDVERSRSLYERMMDDSLDLIVIPETFSLPEVTSLPLAAVPNAWMARPGMVEEGRTLALNELANFPIFLQGSRSGAGVYISKWLLAQGIDLPRSLSTGSLTAVVGLTAAGAGLTFLPRDFIKPMIDEGRLMIIPSDPPLPAVPFVMMHRNDRASPLLDEVIQITREVCDFTMPFQS